MRRFFHPDDRAKIAEAASKSRLQGIPSPPLEYRIIRPDGAVRTVYREHDWEFGADGCPIRRIVTFKDITELKANEMRLRESLDNLNRVQRIAGIGSTTEDLATGEYAWSPGACAIFGVNNDEVGNTLDDMRQFYHPGDRAKVVEAADLARLQGEPAPPLEYRIVRPDGAMRWVYRENDIQFDAAGRAIRRIVTFKDITDLKAKETQLRVAMDHLNRIQRIAGIGSIEVDLRTEREHISWSPSACELFGLDPASVEPPPEFLLNLIHPDDRAKAKKASDRANSTGTAAPPLEYRIVRPDGAERILYRENAIQHDDGGQPERRIITYKDITEIKATEAQLRQTQDDLNRAQRMAKVGSDVWDLRTGNVVWSEETYRIFGVDPNTFIPTAENFLNFVVPEDRPGLLARRQELLRGNPPAATEISICRPDGEVRRIYSEAELIRDPKGKPIRWVGMRQDITAQSRAERSLRDAKEAAETANVAKSQFLANTSHELRTPLNAIIGFSDMLRLGLVGRLSAKQKEYVALIHQSSQHLLSVINDILDLAHVDSGKFELHEEAGVAIRYVIDACLALMRDRVDCRGASTVDRDRRSVAPSRGRSDAAEANPAEPDIECHQIYRTGRFGSRHWPSGPERWYCARSAGYRTGDDAERDRHSTRTLRPSRCQSHPAP
jgi:PAS domain S-box-containing protein